MEALLRRGSPSGTERLTDLRGLPPSITVDMDRSSKDRRWVPWPITPVSA
jgi:hypothetical protein